ncbi:MAG: fumarylacetoacetate hydrolase family protein [Cyclobacteriaceae bacterium]
MKIACIGRNYVAHIEELGNERPDSPVIFLKPDTAIIRNNDPFYYPDFSKDIHHEIELVVKISQLGKSIETEFAHKYYNEIGLGVDFTARDLQAKAKTKGLPWDLAKSFNGSAPISNFLNKDQLDLSNTSFSLLINEQVVQQGNTSHMLYSVDEIISYISKFITLKKGDLIFTGTPKGVGPVQIGDRLVGFIENQKMLDFEIR